MFVLQTLIWILIVIFWLRAALSWLPRSSIPTKMRGLERFCFVVTEPVLAPLRRILPQPRVARTSIDLSILIVMIVLCVLSVLL